MIEKFLILVDAVVGIPVFVALLMGSLTCWFFVILEKVTND